MSCNQKSRMISFILTFFLGPLGLFYSSVGGALVLSFATVASIINGSHLDETVVVGSIITYWVLAMVMGYIATQMHNKHVEIAKYWANSEG